MSNKCWDVTVREYVQTIRVKSFTAATAEDARALAEEEDWREWPQTTTEVTLQRRGRAGSGPRKTTHMKWIIRDAATTAVSGWSMTPRRPHSTRPTTRGRMAAPISRKNKPYAAL
jgi:hypothetical protein